MAVRKLKQSWWIDFRHEGERHRLRSPDNTKAGALVYEALIRRRLANGEPLKARTDYPIFAEFVEEWYEQYVKIDNKMSTIKTKRSTIDNHLVPFFGKMRLDKISVRDVILFQGRQIKKGLNKKTINNQVGILTKCLHSAHEWRVLDVQPPKIKKLKVAPTSFDYLTTEECGLLLSNESEPMWRLMILTAMHTGMRLGELCGLKWQDIDFMTGVISIQRNIVRGVIGSPKSNKMRYVPMTTQLSQVLERARQKDGYVFHRNDLTGKEPITQSVAGNAIRRLCKAVGLRHIGWHTLRHTFASHLVQKGASLAVVQELLGHSTIEMTMRYAHLAPTQLTQAIQLLEIKAVRPTDAHFGQPVGNRLAFVAE